jgi:O-antigen/teichoic acid export membrane protein
VRRRAATLATAGEPIPVAPQEPASEGARGGRLALGRAGVVVAVSMGVGNALNYGYHVFMSRKLGPSSYGALGALLAVTFIFSVPGLALQSIVARHTALRYRDGRDVADLWAGIMRAVLVVAAALAALTAVASPWIASFLHLGSVAPALWLAVAIFVLPVVPAILGMLQGRERFTALGVTLLGSAAGKLLLGALFVELGFGVSGALAGAAAGSILGALIGVGVARPGLAGGSIGWPLVREMAVAGVGIFALFVIVNIDIVLARHFLSRDLSGLYAVGTIVAKITYWAPRFVTVVVFPRLSTSPDRGQLLARAIGFIAVLCLVVVAVVAATSNLLLREVFGHSYARLGPALWLFAGIGTVFALVHLLLFSGIAAGNPWMSRVVAVAVVVKTSLMVAFFHHSVTQIASVVLVTGIVLLGIGLALEYRRGPLPAPAVAVNPAEAIAE